jgi:hypothetical protein
MIGLLNCAELDLYTCKFHVVTIEPELLTYSVEAFA